MNIKHSIIALGAAGATAALVFGGSAVSTAFTSNHDGSFASKSATIADSYQNWDLGLDNAIPGDTVSKTMTYTNSGSVPMRLAITVGQPVTEGADANVSALENAHEGVHPGLQRDAERHRRREGSVLRAPDDRSAGRLLPGAGDHDAVQRRGQHRLGRLGHCAVQADRDRYARATS